MRAPFLRVFRRAKVLTPLASAVLVLVLVAGAGSAVAPAGAAPAPGPSRLTLESQSPAFVANQDGVDLGIDVTSPLPASDLAIEVTLYSAILTRYSLRQTLAGSLPDLLSPLGSPGIVPLDLKSLAWASGREVMLHLPVSAPDLPGRAGSPGDVGTGGVSLSIFNCQPPTCGGVYPLQVSLLEEGVGPLASFTTYLLVTPPSEVAGTHPLRFAWVLPLGTTLAISPSGGAVADPSDLRTLQALESALAAAPDASVSLELFPQFLQSLEDRSDPASRAALGALRALAGPGGRVAVIPGTFVPVDPNALVASGLAPEVLTQLQRARQVLAGSLAFDPHTYVADGPLDQTALQLIEQCGITRLVVPSTAVQPLSPTFAQWTPTTPFIVNASGAEAMASDPGLEEDLASSASPALKAQEMLADLSVQYFAAPGTDQGLVLESPLGGHLDPTFLEAVLAGLSGSLIVSSETLAEVFDTVSPGSNSTSPGRRSLQRVATAPSTLISAAAVMAARRSVAALASVLPASVHVRGRAPLGDLVLLAEGAGETPAQRQAYLSPIEARAAALSRLVSLPFGRTITVTSLQARIPISVVSSAPGPFVAHLTASSPGLGFPKGHSWRITIYPRTNIVQIMLTARTSGDFSLQLSLTTTTGFVLQSGTMTIRSTAISGVAVGLSAGAAAFLLLWWLRSILTKRRKKHQLRGAALAAGDTLPSAPGA